MANPTRPTLYPDWDGVQRQPTSGEITAGFAPDQRPDSRVHNFLFGTAGDWVRWLDFITQQNSAVAVFDAYVGSGLTGGASYADLNTLMTYMAANPGSGIKRIMLIGPQTNATPQVVNQADIELFFKAGSIWTKTGSVTPGLSISADGVSVRGWCRFLGFNGGSDSAIQIETGHKNTSISGMRFSDCTTSINDLGTNSSLTDNIDEV